jgi:F-type H+-transporting ATPase subunit a
MKSRLSLRKFLLLTVFFALISGFFGLTTVFAQDEAASAEKHQEEIADSTIVGEHGKEAAEGFNIGDIIIEHVIDSHIWHLSESAVIYLPVIVYSGEKGLELFSSSHFFEHHKPVEYKGYKMVNDHIYLASTNEKVWDFSITKNVLMLFINATVLLLVMLTVARSYRKNTGKSPKGVQSFMEPVILFVQDSIAKPNIGPKYKKYLPYLLTLFFFILFGNLLGLLPGAGNLTGNIAVTLVLAMLTFFITNFSGKKAYWSHIFWTPGVPHWLRIIILPVELIGILTKPFALTIRLFVAITAGHIVLLALLGLTFIAHSYWVGITSTIFVILISLIELLVAGIQAYVFTLFTALYIGSAVQEHSHEHEPAGHH